MLGFWAILQLTIEFLFLVLHITLAAFIAKQVIKGVAVFKNAFYYVYLLQTVADVGDYVTVGYKVLNSCSPQG